MLILCGMPGCGKDTVLQTLIQTYGMEPVVRYTTRPMRPGEKDGINYYYTDNVAFEAMRDAGLLAEHETFYVADDDKPWHYGSTLKDYNDNKVMICSPDGIEMLMNSPEAEKIFIVQLLVPQDELRTRLKDRPWSREELERRLASDEKRYKRIQPLVAEFVLNYGVISPYMSATTIYHEYEEWLQEHNANQEKERE